MKSKLHRITTVPISFEKLLENQLRFMMQYINVTAISSDKVNLARFGKSQNIPVFHVELTRKITPFKDLMALWRLYNYFKIEKPLIVHTHTPKAGTLGMLAAKMAGVPYRLHTVAGLPLLEANGFKRKLLYAVEKATYACATHIYPNSFGLKTIIVKEQFCKAAKLKVLGNGSSNGVDTTYFNREIFSTQQNHDLKNSLGIKPNEFVFIFVGRLVGDKGINELITAFLNLKPEIRRIKLLLVGPYEMSLDPLLPITINAIKNNSNIVSVGFQADVRPYFNISDCLVFPSYREGFPNVVMQAGAMGLPSIVSNINGCNEIIHEGINGLIIPSKDIAELQLAMTKLLEDNNLYTILKNNARQMITSRYEQKLIWELLLSEYRGLLDGSLL